jgi:membrane protein DedA with SNARE-associated domain
MANTIQNLLEQYGAVAVGLLMLLENIVPPIPSEVIMPWAGFSASRGDMSLTVAIVSGAVGSYVGALLWYLAAKRVGKQRLKDWSARWGAWLTLSPKDIDSIDHWFDKWGGISVLLGRMVPGVRTLISVPAGFSDMSFGRFSLFTAIGTTAWTAMLAGLGWWLGSNYQSVARPLGWASTAVIVALVGWWVYRIIRQSMRHDFASPHQSRDAN